MNRNFNIKLVLLAATIAMMVAGSALAEVNLRWSPGDTITLAPGDTSRLSIHIDDVINFRTIEVTVQYDTTVITSLGGDSGALYANSGYFVFDGFEEEPGSWHAYAVIMGAGEYLTGPGELLYWDFKGLAEGQSPITSVQVVLYDEVSPPVQIPDVMLDNATVIVHDPLSATMDTPAANGFLQVAPNPFNPRARISFDLARDSFARLSVFDMRGRQVAVLYDGLATTGALAVDWNGTDDAGRTQPGGVYLFQLETNAGIARAKGILVK